MQNKKVFEDLLLVSDIDGTLTKLTKIPQKNIDAIKKFIAQGGTFTLCTGRPKCTLKEILPQLPITAPIITINGGYVYSPQNNDVLFEARLPENVKEFVFDLLERFERIGAMLVEPDNYWVIRWGDESIEGVAERRDMYLREGCCQNYTEGNGPNSWHKVVLIVPPKQIQDVREYIEKTKPQGFYPVQSDEFYLELVADGVDKGKAMELVRSYLNLSKTAAIGDRENDKAMLVRADFSAIPKNGDRNLQKEVDFIVDSCDNGAVADFINHLERFYNR